MLLPNLRKHEFGRRKVRGSGISDHSDIIRLAICGMLRFGRGSSRESSPNN